MKAFGADKMGMTEEEMGETVAKWREASPHVVNLWSSLEKAAIQAIKEGCATSVVGSIRFDYEKDPGVLWMTLPSGRRLAYWGAEYGLDKFGKMSITYMSMIQATKKWDRRSIWGGVLTENLIQGMARDCLRESMLALSAAGFDIRAHVHDEVIITEPIDGRSVKEVCEIMGREIPWARGLPLRGDGYECSSYRKD